MKDPRQMTRRDFILYLQAALTVFGLWLLTLPTKIMEGAGTWLWYTWAYFFDPGAITLAKKKGKGKKKKKKKKRRGGNNGAGNGNGNGNGGGNAIVHRKRISDWTQAEIDSFVNALIIVNDNGTYLDFVRRHHEAMSEAHQGPKFLYWHRKYLLEFEALLRSAGTGFQYLPLVLWHTADVNIILDILNLNLLSNWRTLRWNEQDRQLEENPVRGLFREVGQGTILPSEADAKRTGTYTTYDVAPANTLVNSFRNWLEGWWDGTRMHNQIHVWIGGDAKLSTSPNDPLFWVIHTWVDYLWWLWQKMHQGAAATYAAVGDPGTVMQHLLDPTTPAQMEVSPVNYPEGLMVLDGTRATAAGTKKKKRRRKGKGKGKKRAGNNNHQHQRHASSNLNLESGGFIRAESILIDDDGKFVIHNILPFQRWDRPEDAQPTLNKLAAQGRFVPATNDPFDMPAAA